MKLGPIERGVELTPANPRLKWGWIADLVPGESRYVEGVTSKALGRVRERCKAEGTPISIRPEGDGYRIHRVEGSEQLVDKP